MTKGLPQDAQALRDCHGLPVLDCADVPHSDERRRWRRGMYGDPQRVVSVAVRRKSRLAIVLVASAPAADWSLPGGGVERGEPFEGAAIREAKEECGLTVTLRRPLAIVRARLTAPADSMGWVDLVFAAEPLHGHLKPIDTEEMDAARWAYVEEIEGLYAQGRFALSWDTFVPSTSTPPVDAALLAILADFAGKGGRASAR